MELFGIKFKLQLGTVRLRFLAALEDEPYDVSVQRQPSG